MAARLTDGSAHYGLYPARLFRGALFPEQPQARRFDTEEEALAFLKGCIDTDPSLRDGLGRVLAELGNPTEMLPGEAWEREVASRLCSGELLVIQERAVTPVGGNEPPPEPDRPRADEEKTWIEIRLDNEVGQPVPGESYRVELPDGTVKTGTLNSQGMAFIQGTGTAGDCKITFTSLDQEAWEATEKDRTSRETVADLTAFPQGGSAWEVGEGDSIASIAFECGFFPDTLWNHPDNAGLRQARKAPDELLPGDRVAIPGLRGKTETRPTGASYGFRRKGEPVKITFIAENEDGLPFADKKYEITIGIQRYTGTTDGAGRIERSVVPDAKSGKLRVFIEEPGYPDVLTYRLKFGGAGISGD